MTNLAKVIFEEQGYRVNLLNADLAPVFASLSQKKADVFLDAWLPVTMADYITQYGENWKHSERSMTMPVSDWLFRNM